MVLCLEPYAFSLYTLLLHMGGLLPRVMTQPVDGFTTIFLVASGRSS